MSDSAEVDVLKNTELQVKQQKEHGQNPQELHERTGHSKGQFAAVEAHENTETVALEKITKRAPKQAALYSLIKAHQGITWAEIRTLGFTKPQLNVLEKKELIEEKTQKSEPFIYHEGALAENEKLTLTV